MATKVTDGLSDTRLPKTRQEIHLMITLAEIDPLIWRRVIVDASMTLDDLHRVIQLMFEWYDYHLYMFTIGGKRYEAPGEEADGVDAKRTRLSSLHLTAGSTFTYEYDFGDDWHHHVTVESIGPAKEGAILPYVVSGERRGPPEDCGGTGGFEELRDALRNPRHPEHEDMKTWAGKEYDPDRLDILTVRHAVALHFAWAQWDRQRK